MDAACSRAMGGRRSGASPRSQASGTSPAGRGRDGHSRPPRAGPGGEGVHGDRRRRRAGGAGRGRRDGVRLRCRRDAAWQRQRSPADQGAARAPRPTRIVVTTDHDSFAAVILALRAGAEDYLPKPLGEAELVDALLGRTPKLPPVPETPLRLQRICWEHIQRILAQCGHNISEAARRLSMHRRTLQRILGASGRRTRGHSTGMTRRPTCGWGAVARSYGRALHSRMHRQE